MKVAVSPEAAGDLVRLRTFLADKNPTAASQATAALEQAMDSLSIFPERGRWSGIPGLREFLVPFGRSSYVVRYAHLPTIDTILIVRIWHGREARE